MENQKDLVDYKSEKKLSKLDKFEEKLDNFVKKPKVMASMAIILICALALVIYGTASKINDANQLASEISRLEQENKSLTSQNQIMQSQNGFEYQTTQVDKQIFSSGVEAITTAFDNLYNYSMYEMESIGTTKSDAPVLGIIPIDMHSYSYKFADGLSFDRVFQDDVNDRVGQDKATETIFKDGKKYIRNGSLKKSNGTLDGNFSGSFHQTSSQNTAHSFYIVTKSTIKNCTFSIKRQSGKILYYEVEANLDPKLAVKNYAIDVSEQGGTSIPQFDFVKMTCKIDKNGNLISYDINEKMSLSKSVPVIGNVTTQTTNTISTKLISFNKTPSIAEPTI